MPSADEPAVTTISEEIATSETTVPEERGESVGPVIGDDALAFDEVLDDERMAANPTISIGPDGLPVIWYWSEDAEVFFGDGIGSPGGVRIVRCAEATCGAFEVIDASPDISALPPAVFLPNGAPVFVEAGGFPGATEGTGMLDGLAELHVCADAFCSEVETTVLESVDYPDLILNVPQVLVGNRELPILIFQSDAPPAVNSIKIMVCEDRACTASTVTTLIDQAWGPQAYATDNGGLVLLYHDFAMDWLAITCAELDCSDGATTVTIDDALGLIPRGTTPILSGGGPDDDNVEVCFGPACIAIEGVGGADSKAIVGADGLLLLVWVPTESQPDYGHLLVTKCADASCSEHTTVQVASLISDGDLALGRFVVGVGPSVAIGDDGLPLIVYGTIDGLHLIRCLDTACTAPGG
jgi:hypothetical protein